MEVTFNINSLYYVCKNLYKDEIKRIDMMIFVMSMFQNSTKITQEMIDFCQQGILSKYEMGIIKYYAINSKPYSETISLYDKKVLQSYLNDIIIVIIASCLAYYLGINLISIFKENNKFLIIIKYYKNISIEFEKEINVAKYKLPDLRTEIIMFCNDFFRHYGNLINQSTVSFLQDMELY